MALITLKCNHLMPPCFKGLTAAKMVQSGSDVTKFSSYGHQVHATML